MTTLVTGATGRHGGAVIDHLKPGGWALRALTRTLDGHARQHLTRQGVEVTHGDFTD